ncbi:MAG: 3-dehydroquinate synthase [Pseudomonadota bacterium]
MTDRVQVDIELGERGYAVQIGAGLVTDAQALRGALVPVLSGSEVMVVSNERVAPLYLETVREALSGYRVAEFLLPDGERFKTLAQFERLQSALIEARFSRRCTLIALGGGVVGDLTGFAAACYQRGVAFVQLPTTLLAQVDSSVGGKTAVNHPLGKNMIGAFHQPRCVLVDTGTLATLPSREFGAGMAEVIKYGAIADEQFFDWLETRATALAAQDPTALTRAIQRSVGVKAEIVAADEREAGRRALLNFGHTFGHALETCTHYEHYLHGEAVAVGMVLAARFGVASGNLAASIPERLGKLLRCFALPTEVDRALNVSAAAMLDAMGRDKKVVDGQLRLILLRDLGTAYVTDTVDAVELQTFLERELEPATGTHG